MSLRAVRIVFGKEMRETLRDRRTLIVMLVLPLCLYPLVGIGVIQWIGAQESKRAELPSRVGMVGPSWQELEKAAQRAKSPFELRRVKRNTARRQLRNEQIDLVLSLPGTVTELLAKDGTVGVKVAYDDTRPRSVLAHRRVKELLNQVGDTIRDRRLRARSLPASLIRPLTLEEERVHAAGDKGAHLMAGVVPLLVILMVLLGAFYPAIDVTAGEKERGTLETLLVAPVERTSLIAGKYLVVAVVAVVAGLLNLGSIGLTLVLGVGPALRAAGLAVEIPWGAVVLTAVATVPAALFFAAISMAVAALGRSFKEAQNLLTPVMMVCTLPVVVTRLPGVELTPFSAVLPVINVSLLIRDLISGRVEWGLAGLTVVSLLFYTWVALKLGARAFESERLLFAPDPGAVVKASLWRRLTGRVAPTASAPSSSQAAMLFLVVIGLILIVGRPLQSASLTGGLLVTEWILIGLPVLLLVRLGRLDVRTSLALWRPSAAALLGALLVGLSAWYLVGVLVELVQQRVLPMPEELVKEYHRALFSTDRLLWVDLFVLALSPAICEEALFRGVLLQATRRTMSISSAVLINGLLFGLFHLSPYRFFSTALLGVLLALLVLRAGSIWPGVLFHFLNNASAIVAGRLVTPPAEGAPIERAVSYPMLASALVLFGVGMAIVFRSPLAATRGPSDPPDRSG